MFSAINKTLCAAAFMLALAACGNADREGAAALLDESRSAVAGRDFVKAIGLLDTINSRYRGQTEIRREALAVRAEAMEGIAIDSISAGDQALAEATLRVQNLEGGFKHVDSNVGLDGYYLPKDATDKVMTGIFISWPTFRVGPSDCVPFSLPMAAKAPNPPLLLPRAFLKSRALRLPHSLLRTSKVSEHGSKHMVAPQNVLSSDRKAR